MELICVILLMVTRLKETSIGDRSYTHVLALDKMKCY